MPRQSARARADAAYAAGAGPIAPPRTLSREAAAVWRGIVASKPADWFDAGSWPLLENFCELTVQARYLSKELGCARRMKANELMKDLERRLALVTGTLTTTATKLRLSVQNLVERHSRKILERGQAPITSKAKADRLLGGDAVWGKGSQTKPN